MIGPSSPPMPPTPLPRGRQSRPWPRQCRRCRRHPRAWRPSCSRHSHPEASRKEPRDQRALLRTSQMPAPMLTRPKQGWTDSESRQTGPGEGGRRDSLLGKVPVRTQFSRRGQTSALAKRRGWCRGRLQAQAGGAVASGSASFTPAKRWSHQGPAGKTTSRPARFSWRASRTCSMNALFRCRASMRAHLFLQATLGDMPRLGSRLLGLAFQCCLRTVARGGALRWTSARARWNFTGTSAADGRKGRENQAERSGLAADPRVLPAAQGAAATVR
jgi:hypothetical protein